MSTHSHGPYTRPLFVCVSLLPHRYWPIRPLATCTAWIAIDDSREDNGALQVIPGSHTVRTLLHHEHRDDPEHLALDLALPTTSFDHARAVTLTLEPGQVSFHDVFLVHGSEPNRSSRSRRGMTVRFMPTTSVYNHTSASNAAMATLPVFLAAGRDVSGANNIAGHVSSTDLAPPPLASRL